MSDASKHLMPLPPAPPPKRIQHEDAPGGVLLLFFGFLLGTCAVAGIAICLIGYGEHRAAAHCAQLTTSTLNQE